MISSVPVPASCSALLLVVAPTPLPRHDDIVRPLPAFLRRNGSDPQQVASLESQPHQMLLHTSAPTAQFAEAAVALRRQAFEIAAKHSGTVICLLPARVLSGTAAEVSLEYADQWYVLDPDAIADEEVRTDGLDVFGLPNIVVTGVVTGRRPMVDAVVAGLVHRLLQEWPTNDPMGPATITLRDIAFGLGDTSAEDTGIERSINVLIDYASAGAACEEFGLAHDEDDALVVTLLEDPAEVLFAP